MVAQFIASMLATVSFAILYSTPKRHLLYCSITGALGWIIYLIFKDFGANTILCNFASAFSLSIIARIFAVFNQAPVTLYLFPGIIPIVPGAGIYYTAYYFFMNNMYQSGRFAQDTAKTVLAICFGIIFAMAIPQKLFKVMKKGEKKNGI